MRKYRRGSELISTHILKNRRGSKEIGRALTYYNKKPRYIRNIYKEEEEEEGKTCWANQASQSSTMAGLTVISHRNFFEFPSLS